jgi:CheY-like chemotaxis protein
VEQTAFDVLLCDLHLSAAGFFLDGREAAARILKASGIQKPFVIYMTGDLMDSVQPSTARGEPRFLQKPFRISEVLSLFREVLVAAPAESRLL